MGCAGSAIVVRCLQNVWHRDFSPEKLTPVYGCLNVQSGCRHDAGVPVRRRHPGGAGTERSTGGLLADGYCHRLCALFEFCRGQISKGGMRLRECHWAGDRQTLRQGQIHRLHHDRRL